VLQAENIHCALHDRVFSFPLRRDDRSWRGILLSAGSGAVRSSTGDLIFGAATLVWGPWTPDMSLWINAGSVGAHFAVSEDALSNAIGHNAESSELRLLADRLIAAQLDPESLAFNDCTGAFNLILREVETRQNGSVSMIHAQVRAILVLLWRNSSNPEISARSVGRTLAILGHFRQLVETHFRDHWPVRKYAENVGISPDRLHDICSKNLGKRPSQLVHERQIYEARMMLENTTLSVEQLSGALGFRDVTYFSRFFRHRVGVPPATYRRNATSDSAPETLQASERFADWP
jgi:AraC family transcriptional activator of pobA